MEVATISHTVRGFSSVAFGCKTVTSLSKRLLLFILKVQILSEMAKIKQCVASRLQDLIISPVSYWFTIFKFLLILNSFLFSFWPGLILPFAAFMCKPKWVQSICSQVQKLYSYDMQIHLIYLPRSVHRFLLEPHIHVKLLEALIVAPCVCIRSFPRSSSYIFFCLILALTSAPAFMQDRAKQDILVLIMKVIFLKMALMQSCLWSFFIWVFWEAFPEICRETAVLALGLIARTNVFAPSPTLVNG